jgi:hypothetical protein
MRLRGLHVQWLTFGSIRFLPFCDEKGFETAITPASKAIVADPSRLLEI